MINIYGDKPTLNDGKQDNHNEEEEGNIKEDSVGFQRISIRRFQLITDTTSSTNAFVQVEYEALKYIKRRHQANFDQYRINKKCLCPTIICEFVAYREHVMTFLICFLSFLLKNIKLSEEIEGYNCVDVDNDGQQENG